MLASTSVELALGIANAAVKLGLRVDQIQTQHLIGGPLPYKLPPTPPAYGELVDDMISYFNSGAGQALLADDDKLNKIWERYLQTNGGSDEVRYAELLVERWVVIAGQTIPPIGADKMPPVDPGRVQAFEYYIVSAAKPGHQRSALIDIALATADVALEFVSSNPAIITKDPAVQKAIRSFLTYFTKGDLEKLSYRQLFERTLSSVIRTAIDNRELVENVDGLNLFLEALAEAQNKDADFVAGLVAGKNFDKLLQSVVQTLGENAGQFTNDIQLADMLGRILQDIASDDVFKKILGRDEDAIALVVQVAIGHVATHPILLEKVAREEVWHTVVQQVLAEIGKSAKKRKLFANEALGSLVSAALKGVAINKGLVEGDFVKRFVASFASGLGATELKDLLGEKNLPIIAAAALNAAAKHTDLLIKGDELLATVLSAVMTEGTKGFGNGFTRDYAIDLAVVAIDAVGKNASAIDLPKPFGKIVATVLNELSRDELREHLVAGDVLSIFTNVLQIVAANPGLWKEFVGGELPKAVLGSIAEVIADDPTKLLRGPVLASLIIEVLDAVTLRAQAYARVESGKNPELTKLLQETLKRLKNEIGLKVGASNIVTVIVSLVLDWGKDKFTVDADDPSFKSRVGEALLAA
ncbi:hypothetical protein HED60_13895 [Planctomycetales bacterium ZRK34]|nr:hypothetical protein HED60_13895 [Planctomycetales bacterium ZRK34]